MADPLLAVNKLNEVLLKSKLEEKKQLTGMARRILVSTLADYAVRENFLEKELFIFAMTALAELAVAENESWANNATNEFHGKFQFFRESTEEYQETFLFPRKHAS